MEGHVGPCYSVLYTVLPTDIGGTSWKFSSSGQTYPIKICFLTRSPGDLFAQKSPESSGVVDMNRWRKT